VREDKVSIVRACLIVDLDRSMFYYQSTRDDSEMEAKLGSSVEISCFATGAGRSITSGCAVKACHGSISGWNGFTARWA